ncbi:MAG: NAD(P)/FAD-dependent oxidoreductase [Muribaculaceae bacterium]|nr:NAD(P)/FAD-dependent oxidoreductase [Muribaculaceae bacterium]
MNLNDDTRRHLVIIGGGFGGLNLAGNVDKKQWRVTVIDRHNYHSFPPLFYQVASSGLEPASISFPFRRELRSRRYRGCEFHLGEVSRIDTAGRVVHTQYETVPYDALVIAAGTTNNYFGIPELEKHVFTIKSTPEAIRCRNEVLDRLERAALCRDPVRRNAMLTFVVVGGGPAGVEIAGALGELKKYILKREYPTVAPDEMKVVLVEGTQRLLGAMSEKSSADALEGLRQLLVDVRLGKRMKSYDDGVLTFDDGTSVATDTVIWTAGVTGVPFDVEGADVKPVRGARWEVDEFNAVKGLDGVYAIGDIAMMPTGKYLDGHPQVAQVALQMGENLAYNLNNLHRPGRPFVYRDKGSMATIGRNRAVVDMGKIHLSGGVAWLTWLFVHLMSLLGMRNKTVVFINWMWSYFTFSAGLRLLMRPKRYPLRNYRNE